MKIRFSLRALFILLTISTVVLGFRHNQRRSLQHAANVIQENEGSVFYHWQSLYVVYVSCQVPNAYYQIQLPITETLPDGQQVTKTIMQIARRNVGHSINSQQYKVKKLDPPGFRLSTFLLGSHDDVDVAAVSIPAASINEETVEVLRRLRGLESVLLRVNKKYYAVEASHRCTVEQRQKDLLRLGKDLEQATRLLEASLPDVVLHRRGVVDDD